MARPAPRDWYKDAVFYEVHVKAFMDGNGDGVGDFAGLIERLDYVQELGVDCLWILPMYPSPLRDDGYDIADFYGIHPSYGTVQDFQKFLDAAHARGLRVIADLVMNHTSDQHPWFQASRSGPTSTFADYYVWSPTDHRFRDARVIFVDTEKSNWTLDPARGEYYWHRFFSHQPDLNYDNPAVRRSMLDVMRFWLDRGLDGFRCDAVPYLVEREGTNCENLPETHAILKEFRAVIDREYGGARVLLAEANQWPEDVRPYFGDGDEFHMAFNFPLMPRLYLGLRLEDSRPITDIFTQMPPIPSACQWGLFLRNHDELTLEMVTNEERAFMYYAYAYERDMKLNLGIRRRLAPLMDGDRRRVELLNCLLLTLPGSPIIYYGDEIGMGDNVALGDRDGVRTPMQWSRDRNAGFSRSDADRLYLPVIADPVYG
jgi:maltose alpha-D-glucosyltransferase / alpha-amylase